MRFIVTVGFIATLAASAANAQTVGLGTTRAGASAAISAAIANVVSKHGDLKMRTEVFASGEQAIPRVNAGKLEFTTSNIAQLTLSIRGGNDLAKEPNPNLRMVATLMPFSNGLLVKDEGPIKKITDMRGQRFSGGFNPQPLARLITEAYLANAGLTWSDVEMMPASGFVDSWNQMKVGRVDGVTIALGTAMAREIELAVGKVRYVDLDPAPDRVAAVRKVMPGAYIKQVDADPAIPGLDQTRHLMQYDYTLFSGKDISDEVVYKVTKALYENAQELKSSSPHWKLFDPRHMSKDLGVAYHPGAVRFWKEIGMMP